MTTSVEIPKITYTTMSLDQIAAFNRAFDDALDLVRRDRLNKDHPLLIGGREMWSDAVAEDPAPHDRRIVLGRFAQATADQVTEAVTAARGAVAEWGAVAYPERVRILRRVAQNFRENRFEIGVVLALEAGKTRLESIGEVDEAADLIDTYCDQLIEHDGYVIELKHLDPGESNRSVLKPYGVFAVIAPFNFPVALTTGMIAGALTGGNAVVYKPSNDTPHTAHYVYRMFESAGIPAGTLNLVTGSGSVVGQSLITNPAIDGIAFIGSKEVGFHIIRSSLLNYPRPCIAEMGGKNPVLVMESADLDKAVVGTGRAAFGYSGQKCSAASRVYVQSGIYDDFVGRLVDYSRTLKVADPTLADTFMGPVINEAAYRTFQQAAGVAKTDGSVVLGGEIMTAGEFSQGFFVEPTIAELPTTHRYFAEELFLPFLSVGRVESLNEAIELANASEFGLTAGIFTEDPAEQQEFLNRMQAGVLYVNRKGGATTGAWPGAQSFGGWKGSGSTGKSALGPYYVAQFMHEQSQTVVS